jgi:hypothetical protein
MSAGSDKNKIEIDIAEEWTERIGKTANKICDDSDNNRKVKMMLGPWAVLDGLSSGI